MAYSTISKTPPTIVASAIFPALAVDSTCGVLNDRALSSRPMPGSASVVSADAVAVPAVAALGVSAGDAPALEASTG